MIFGEGPIIKNIAGDLNKLFLQGTRAGQPINNVEGDAAADQGTIQLMADRDPVIRDISTGLGWAGREVTVSGTGPLQLVNSLGRPLKSWSVELAPYQEGSGDPSPDNVRPIHGTNKLTIYTDSKYGGLVEWNQQCKTLDTSNWGPTTGATVTISDGEAQCIELTGTWQGIFTTNMSVYAGHKYLLELDAKMLSGISCTISSGLLRPYPAISLSSSEYVRIGTIVEQTTDVLNAQMTIANRNNTNSFAVKNIQLFDLTAMFGAGNEPTTVEEFRALFPNDYYAYNAGQQKTVDQVNGSSYTPAVITLPQTIYNGSISDGGVVSNWGLADMSSNAFSWSYDNVGKRWQSTLIGLKSFETRSDNIIAEKYKADITASAGSENVMFTVGGAIYIYYSDSANAPSGQLVYPLATPTTITLSTPSIPTPTGNATAWVTAEDGIVTSFSATYLQAE